MVLLLLSIKRLSMIAVLRQRQNNLYVSARRCAVTIFLTNIGLRFCTTWLILCSSIIHEKTFASYRDRLTRMGNSGFIVVMVAVTNFKESWLDLEVALPLPQSGFYHPHTRHQLHRWCGHLGEERKRWRSTTS
jgi:hypothetical protein